MRLTPEIYKDMLAHHGSLAQVARALERDPRNLRRWVKKNVENITPPGKTKESVVLHLTDLHYGKKTDTFDIDVLEARLDGVIQRALGISRILNAGYKFDKVYVMLTGDLVDGNEIYANHPYHVDQRASYGRAQAKKCAKMLKPRLLALKDIAPKIEIHGVPGNHGRISKYTHEMNNWDLVLYDNLSLMLDDKDVSVTSYEKNLAVVNVQGHGFLLYHGAGIRMYQQLPFYGIRQRVLRWSQTLKEPFDVVLMGHFHQCIEDAVNDTRILLSGTAVSDDDWAIECLGVDGSRKTNFFGVHPDHPITWQYRLDIDLTKCV